MLKGTSNKVKVPSHVLAWHDPALLFRGRRPSQLSRQKNPGKRVPRQLASSETSRLAYEGNFKETEKELAQNSFRTVSPELVLEQLPVPRLNLNSLIQYTDLSFQLQSLQQTELVAAYPVVASLSSSPKTLQQKELEATYSAKRSLTALLGPTRARELQLTTAQLCKEQLGETECSTRAIQLKSFQLTNAQLCFTQASFSLLSGGGFKTTRRRGGVLKEACLPHSP